MPPPLLRLSSSTTAFRHSFITSTATQLPSSLRRATKSLNSSLFITPLIQRHKVLFMAQVMSSSSSSHQYTNRLAAEHSPYLLQHAHNPVNWYPWGEEAFAEARRRDVPIFLSIGYSTWHWCHVMEVESLEDLLLAQMLNDWFVSVKVDREERPDVDKVYMTFVQALCGGGGWPLSVFLSPDLKPLMVLIFVIDLIHPLLGPFYSNNW